MDILVNLTAAWLSLSLITLVLLSALLVGADLYARAEDAAGQAAGG